MNEVTVDVDGHDQQVTLTITGTPSAVAYALREAAFGTWSLPRQVPDDLLPARPAGDLEPLIVAARLLVSLKRCGDLPFVVRRAYHRLAAETHALASACPVCRILPGRWCRTRSGATCAAHAARRGPVVREVAP